jgi:peptidoglycan/xylan/chitin deacetylase (PgdA/CDA1 family)
MRSTFVFAGRSSTFRATLMALCAFASVACQLEKSSTGKADAADAADANDLPGDGNDAQPTDGNATQGLAAGHGNGKSNGSGASINANVAAIAWPNLGFVNNPGGKDPNSVALSFDDVPDGSQEIKWGKASPSNMAHVLDQLDALKLKATFFMNAHNWCDAKNDLQAQTDIKRMLAAGHAIGSHTYSHPDLIPDTARNRAAKAAGIVKADILTPAQIKAQFVDNDAAFADPKLLGPSLLPFTMYRAPFGYPFQDGVVYPATEQSIVEDVSGVAPYSSYNAVHVGWGIDSRDWECVQNPLFPNSALRVACIVNTVKKFLDKGATGVILLHAIYKESGDALPLIVDLIQQKGLKIVQVEDYVRDKYGASSADIYRANAANPTPFDATAINAAAVAAAKESKWYKQNNEG